jgi:hypothetical protein
MRPKVFLDGVSGLNVETLNDLGRRLREVGYSDSAVKEILKWYKQNGIDRKT